jgi:hypothetical protein
MVTVMLSDETGNSPMTLEFVREQRTKMGFPIFFVSINAMQMDMSGKDREEISSAASHSRKMICKIGGWEITRGSIRHG